MLLLSKEERFEQLLITTNKENIQDEVGRYDFHKPNYCGKRLSNQETIMKISGKMRKN